MENLKLRPGQEIVPILGIRNPDGTVEIPTRDGSQRMPPNSRVGIGTEGERLTIESNKVHIMGTDDLTDYLRTQARREFTILDPSYTESGNTAPNLRNPNPRL